MGVIEIFYFARSRLGELRSPWLVAGGWWLCSSERSKPMWLDSKGVAGSGGARLPFFPLGGFWGVGERGCVLGAGGGSGKEGGGGGMGRGGGGGGGGRGRGGPLRPPTSQKRGAGPAARLPSKP